MKMCLLIWISDSAGTNVFGTSSVHRDSKIMAVGVHVLHIHLFVLLLHMHSLGIILCNFSCSSNINTTRCMVHWYKIRFTCVVHWYKMDPGARKPVFGVCEQHRRRPAYASAQSDQRLWYSPFCNTICKLATREISIF